MDKLKMHTENKVDINIEKIGSLFPNTLTEKIKGYDENNKPIIEKAIDFDILKQELSKVIVEGREERYQMNWPGKKEAILTANAPINKTLRPCREESVDFDKTENLYIEGDNLEVLKLLQETYLNKVKIIYIDPPYNTGNDSFVYDDDFSMSSEEFSEASGQYDEDGNMNYDIRKNSESNGRFHTDWLNMMYPRLKLARDLLSDDGVIFISIDDNENTNLKIMCDEIFGTNNFIAEIIRNTNSSKNQSLFVSVSHEYCLVYSKNMFNLKNKHSEKKWSVPKNNIKEYERKVQELKSKGLSNEEITEELKELTKYPRFIDFTNYWYFDEVGLYQKGDLGGVKNGNNTPIMNPLTNKLDPIPPGGFRYKTEKLNKLIKENKIHFHMDGSLPRIKRYLHENMMQRPKSIMSDDQRPDNSLLKEFNTPFDNPKQLAFIKRILSVGDNDSIILDFFSGSSTTAHSVMQLNAEDGGNRKFIMVQLPEETDEKSEARKAGYENICKIGKERIRRAGKKIKEENPDVADKLDTGFRVLKLDSSNMKDVYYNPNDYNQDMIEALESNIKDDRTDEDLLFQVMLDLGELLSSDIKEIDIQGKKVFNVGDGNIVACFDEDITNEVLTEIAKMQPFYAIFRDSSLSNDSVVTNFEQIFKTYSPNTITKVL